MGRDRLDNDFFPLNPKYGGFELTGTDRSVSLPRSRYLTQGASPEWTGVTGLPVHGRPELFFPIGNTGPALLQIEDAETRVRSVRSTRPLPAMGTRRGAGPRVWAGMSETSVGR